jgi:hypothetical protein
MFCDWCIFNHFESVFNSRDEFLAYGEYIFLFEFLPHKFDFPAVFSRLTFVIVNGETNIIVLLLHGLDDLTALCLFFQTYDNIVCI